MTGQLRQPRMMKRFGETSHCDRQPKRQFARATFHLSRFAKREGPWRLALSSDANQGQKSFIPRKRHRLFLAPTEAGLAYSQPADGKDPTPGLPHRSPYEACKRQRLRQNCRCGWLPSKSNYFVGGKRWNPSCLIQLEGRAWARGRQLTI